MFLYKGSCIVISQEGSHIADSKYQICSVENGLINKWKHMGSWSEKTGISMKQFKLFGNDFLDFGNATLKVAAVPVSLSKEKKTV